MSDKFSPHVERLSAVAVSPSRRLFAVGGKRDVPGQDVPTSVTVLTVAKLAPHAVLSAGAEVCALVFCNDDIVLAGSVDGTLRGWDVSGEAAVTLFETPLHDGAIRSLARDPRGTVLASAGHDGALCVFRLAGDYKSIEVVSRHALSTRALRAVAIDATASTVAVAGDDAVVRALALVDGATTGPVRDMPMPAAVTSLELTGDGRIACGCVDGALRLCYLEGAADVEDRSKEAAHLGAVHGLILGPDLTDDAGRRTPRRMFSIGEDGQLKSWQVDSKRKPKTVELGSAPLRGMAWVEASRGAKPERRGGTLLVVDWRRRISVLRLSDAAELADTIERVHSRLDELAGAVEARGDKVRAAAIEALSNLPEDEARSLLDKALAGDAKVELRVLAAEAIARNGSRRHSRPAVRAALDDRSEVVRAAALRALTEIESESPLAVARAALASSYDDMRFDALSRLPGLRAVSPLVPTLVAGALSDTSDVVRQAALDALYTLEADDPAAAARVAMQRGPADVRQDVLLRMGRNRQTADEISAGLLERALDDDDGQVRERAFLVAIGSRAELAAAVCAVDATTRAALDELEKHGAFSDRSAATGQLDDTERGPLFSAMACRNADTALRAARCLAQLGDRRATGALLQLSREADSNVRRQVVEALSVAAVAMPGDARLVARLQWLTDDPESTIRNAAFDVLAGLGHGGPAELDLAGLALRSSQHDIRLRSLPILVRFGGDGQYASVAELAARADSLLGDALDDEHDKVRGEAFRTLWAWHRATPHTVLTRAAQSRHADIRTAVVTELGLSKPQSNKWADDLLLALVGDAADAVGLAAFEVLFKLDDGPDRVDVFEAALASPRPAVRLVGCRRVRKGAAALVPRLLEILRADTVDLRIAAIEAIDRVSPDNAEGFALALGSEFYELSVRAMELCGVRRDKRAVAPAKALLSIPDTRVAGPTDPHRQRAARALADIGDPASIRFCVSLLDDRDPIVREMGARALATACRPGEEQPLVDGLAHEDLAVRSWVAEGLARLGDDRAVPVLAGTLRHDHLPLRQGAIMGFVALGPDGVGGLLQGLDDSLRDIQDLVFAVVVARDVALAKAGEPPDLLLSALSSSHPEIRFFAARVLEERGADMMELAKGIVGPRAPEKAADMKQWPDDAEQAARLELVVSALASDHPVHRYAAAQILTLRPQPLAFWREAKHIGGPTSAKRPRIPFTNWDAEPRQPHKKGWLRALFRGVGAAPAASSETERVLGIIASASAGRSASAAADTFDASSAERLAFGTYAGLVRQAPLHGAADETHRVRRDSIGRLAALAGRGSVGRHAVLPMLRQALSDPHHMVRRAAVAALRPMYSASILDALRLELQSTAADVGRGAVDELIAAAPDDPAAFALAKTTIDAPVAEVRAYALSKLPRLFESGSLDPWLIALASQHADVRLSVVDRLVDSTDARVSEALGRAMESDHEDLRLKAAVALANRGERRTVDVLAALLRSEEGRVWKAALEALIALAHVRSDDSAAAAAAAAQVIVARLDDDPDKTADRAALVGALGRLGTGAAGTAGEALLALLADDDSSMRQRAFAQLLAIARDRDASPRTTASGTRRAVYHEALALEYATVASKADDVELRRAAATMLRDVDARGAEAILAELIEDRDEGIRVAACEALAFRAEHVEGATIDALSAALRGGRRELVLPAAAGLAGQRRPEAFQGLLLVFKAGEQDDRRRAILSLGTLGDDRALAELEPLLDPKAELEDEDRALAPDVVEAFGRMLPSLRDADTEKRIRDTVENMAREGDPDMRLRALIGLRHAGDDRSRAFLREVAADRVGDHSIRCHAIDQLGHLATADSEPLLTDVIVEGDASLSRRALAALRAIFPTDRTRVSLIALRSPRADVSEPAAAFLAWHGDASTLIERMATIKDDRVRRQLRQGLVRRGAAPTATLISLLTGAELPPRADAAWIAGASGDRALADAVVTAVTNSARDFAAATERAGRTDHAGQALVTHAEAAWQASLWAAQQLDANVDDQAIAALRSPGSPASVRCAALRYLGARGTAAIEVVTQALSDPSAEVRTAAAAALAASSPDTSARVLADLTVPDLAAMAPIVRAAVRDGAATTDQLLASSTGRQLAVPVLLADHSLGALARAATAPGKDPKRLAAIAALGRGGADEAVTTLETILANASEDDAVRAGAFRALRRLQRSLDKQREMTAS